MLSTFLAFTVIAFSGGRSSCDDKDPLKQSLFVEYVKPLIEKYETSAWVSCFEGPKELYVWDSQSKETRRMHYEDAMEHFRDFVYYRTVVSVGHSWGGWLQLKSAEEFLSFDHFMYTLDPISNKNCRIFGPWKDCKKFPSDVRERSVAINTLRWYNYFQEEDHFLHSGPSQYAYNEKIKLGHHELKRDPKIWNKIKNSIDKHLQFYLEKE